MRAVYVKNGAVCVANGAMIVGTDSAEPPCVCGDQPDVITDPCCPPSLPAYLPPRGPSNAFLPVSVDLSIRTFGFTRPVPSVTITTTQEMDFSGPVTMLRPPPEFGQCPNGSFSANTVETTVTTNTNPGGFPQFQPGTVVRNLPNTYFVVFSRYGSGANAKLEATIRAGGISNSPFVRWRQTAAESSWQNPRPGSTSVLTGMASTLSGTYHNEETAANGNTSQDYAASISTLSACVASTSTGCTNCGDDNTGAALI